MPRQLGFEIGEPEVAPVFTHKADNDGRAELFRAGLTILMQGGQRETSARRVLGRWLKKHEPGAILEALRQAELNRAAEPVSYTTQLLQSSSHTNDAFAEFIRNDA